MGTVRGMTHSHKTLPMWQVLICGAAIVTLSMGIRHGFGLWLAPITMDRGWTRETFAFALAIQNIAWGAAGPFAGMLADRFGAFRVLVVGALLYAAGLVLIALWIVAESRSSSPLIDMAMMRVRPVWTNNLVAFLVGVGMYMLI